MIAITAVDIMVPTRAKVKIAPKLSKNAFFRMLYPAWKIIGGKSK